MATQSRLGDCPTVKWFGLLRRIIPGTVQRRADLSAGGLELNADLQFDAPVSEFGADATSVKDAMLRTYLEYLGDRYQVASVGIMPGGFVITVSCNAIDQSA